MDFEPNVLKILFLLKNPKKENETYNVWILFNGLNVSLANVLSWLSYNDNKLNFSNPWNVSPRTHTILFALSNLCIKKWKNFSNKFYFKYLTQSKKETKYYKQQAI